LPGGEGGAGTTTPAPNVPLLPNLGESGSGSIAPKSGEKEPAKNPELQKPSAKPPEGIPLKPELPSLPGEFQPPKPTAPSGALRRRRDTVAAGDAEPSTNAARAADRQIEPDDGLEDAARHERKLVETNFEQRDSGAKRTLPNALDGYCPVQLQEKEKWVAGRSEFRVTYQGQVFRFSSEAAKERFAAAPEKYAPANGGNDAVLGMEENRIMSGSIQHSAVWQGRLYLFASSANLAAFREDPSRYAKCPPATEPNAVAAPRTAAESTASKRPQQAEERLRLPGDSL
jgi:YHS domain-containing protein